MDVALRMPEVEFKLACKTYLNDVPYEKRPVESFLSSAIRISLVAVQEKRDQTAECLPHAVSEMHISLCVLRNQQTTPLSGLSKIWNTDLLATKQVCDELISMFLVRMTSASDDDGGQADGILLDSLLLDYCCYMAEKSRKSATWHRQLLEGQLVQEIPSISVRGLPSDVVDEKPDLDIFDGRHRSLWKPDVLNREYLSGNLCRHLSKAELRVELAATVLHTRWLKAQAVAGEIVAMRADFKIALESFAGNSVHEVGVRKMIQLVGDAVDETKSQLPATSTVAALICGVREMWERKSPV